MNKFSIGLVTTLYNSEDLIERTLISIFDAARSAPEIHINYVIKDAKSTDESLNRIYSLVNEEIENLTVTVISTSDSGMYDGIKEGFFFVKESDVYCYLNSGDVFSKDCFNIVKRMVKDHQFHWFTGLDCLFSERGELIYTNLPFLYDRDLIKRGFYGDLLPFIQQESTFWSSWLHSKIDWNKLTSFKYAGDYYLWHLFSTYSELNICEYYLGGFAYQDGQLSSTFRHEYLLEMKSISSKRSAFSYLKSIIIRCAFLLPNRLKRKYNEKIVSDLRVYVDE